MQTAFLHAPTAQTSGVTLQALPCQLQHWTRSLLVACNSSLIWRMALCPPDWASEGRTAHWQRVPGSQPQQQTTSATQCFHSIVGPMRMILTVMVGTGAAAGGAGEAEAAEAAEGADDACAVHSAHRRLQCTPISLLGSASILLPLCHFTQCVLRPSSQPWIH